MASLTLPQFTQLPTLAPLDRRADTWTIEEQCTFSSQLYLQMYFAIAAAMLRDLGPETTYRIYGEMLRDHQKHFFLPGIRKLGLDREQNQAAACAKYHCLSNGLGGLRTGYGVESDTKAWLMYYPYTADNPGSGLFALATHPELELSDYRGWHGNNGRYLGNRGIRFVATHHINEGDAFTGGYFEDTGRDLADDELVVARRGEEPPKAMQIRGVEDDIDPNDWPPERRARALRKYAVTWFADRVRSALHNSADQGEGIARRGIQYMLHTWTPRFRAAVGDERLEPAAELARFIEFFHFIAGIGVKVEPAPKGWDLVAQKGLVEFVGDPMTEGEKRSFSKVLAQSWQSVAATMGCAVSCDDSGTHWKVR